MTFKVKTKGQIEGEKLLVPKLRFKGFNNQWRKIKLKDISTDVSYGMNSAATEYDGFNKYIRITDIDEETSLYNNNNPVSPSGNLDDKFLVKDNDILFARTGASTGKAYLYNKTDGKLYFAGFLIRANIKKDYNSRFIFEQTKLGKYNNWVKIMSIRSGQPGINSIEYGNYEFSITHIDEQKKIANVIELVNKKIELQKQKIEALKIYKKGLIQKYFESKNGEKIKISEILEEVINKTTENNQYDVISSTKDGLFLQSEYFNRSIASDNNIGYKILKKNQIVLSPQNLWMGNINYNNKYEIGMVSPSYKIFNINKNFDKDYISNLLKTNKAIYYYTINSEQGASIVRRNLNMESFYEINFVIPDIEEQNKKGKIINGIAQKIEKEEKKYQKLDKFKKGLLQKMFI